MIPALAHFVWLTPGFPWLNLLAVQSAALRGGFERVVLHHAHELPREIESELRRLPSVELRRLDPPKLLSPSLLARYAELEAPAARSNLLRVAILEREGGVYLDMDTVTIRDLSALRAGRRVFCGLEHVAFPAPRPGQSPAVVRSRGLMLSALRESLRHAPGGWRYFRKLEHWYPRAANNAVLGATAGHAFLSDLLERMARMPRPSALRRYALGTHLLQRALGEYDLDDLSVFPPSFFYPLGPRVSRHWFARCENPDPKAVLSKDTHVVHWYASLHDHSAGVTPESLRQNAERQLFAKLVSELRLLETKKTSPSSVMP